MVLHGVPAGKARVELEFEGKVSDGAMVGLYKSRFDGGYLLTTMLCATNARRLFPCVDHPAYKAVFNVDVTVDASLNVVFNTPLDKEEKKEDGRKTLRFRPTPKMSTYLMYLGVGNIAEVERADGDLRVIVAVPNDKMEMTSYTLDHAGRSVRFFEKFFDVPYPLPKLHLISVPTAWFGGMENWGAIALNESQALVDKNSSALSKRWVVEVIAHEIAHQWFGDLVTMAWWDDVWLNESFATFMSYKAMDEFHPEWNIWNDFYSDNLTYSFFWDALKTTHPIEAKVESPDEIDELFDAISYQKGASVLRMMETYVGEEGFRKGVSDYLRKFQYSNAKGADLWKSIEAASGVPMSHVMESWIKMGGYPVVWACLKGTSLHLEQKRFLLSGESTGELWPLPIILRINGQTKRMLMERESLSIEVGDGISELIVNAGRTGFFRVHYCEKITACISDHFSELSEVDKWGVIEDSYAFLVSGLNSWDDYLALLERCRGETSQLIIGEIVSQMAFLGPLVYGHERVMKVFRDFASSQMDRIGLHPREGEAVTTKVLREHLAYVLVSLDEPSVTALSKEFEHYEDAEPELRGAIARAYAKRGGIKAHEDLVQRFLNAKTESEADKFGRALSSFPEPDLLEKTMELAFDPRTDTERRQSLVWGAIAQARSTPEGRAVLWRWFRKHADAIIAFCRGTAMMRSLLQSFIPFVGLGREVEMRRYMELKAFPGGEAGKKQGLELLPVLSRLHRRLE
jgi:tricorn protease interacting factor F2/3